MTVYLIKYKGQITISVSTGDFEGQLEFDAMFQEKFYFFGNNRCQFKILRYFTLVTFITTSNWMKLFDIQGASNNEGCGYFHGIRNFIILTEVNLRMRCMTAGEFREWIFSEFESFFRQQSRLPNTTVKYQNNNVTAVLLNCFRPNNKNHIAWDSLALAKIIVDI